MVYSHHVPTLSDENRAEVNSDIRHDTGGVSVSSDTNDSSEDRSTIN